MEDPILHLAVHLTLVGALRRQGRFGSDPGRLDFDAANGIGTFTVDRSMQRVRKEALTKWTMAASSGYSRTSWSAAPLPSS